MKNFCIQNFITTAVYINIKLYSASNALLKAYIIICSFFKYFAQQFVSICCFGLLVNIQLSQSAGVQFPQHAPIPPSDIPIPKVGTESSPARESGPPKCDKVSMQSTSQTVPESRYCILNPSRVLPSMILPDF